MSIHDISAAGLAGIYALYLCWRIRTRREAHRRERSAPALGVTAAGLAMPSAVHSHSDDAAVRSIDQQLLVSARQGQPRVSRGAVCGRLSLGAFGLSLFTLFLGLFLSRSWTSLEIAIALGGFACVFSFVMSLISFFRREEPLRPAIVGLRSAGEFPLGQQIAVPRACPRRRSHAGN